MRLAGKVGGLADDVVAARLHRRDHRGILRSHMNGEFLLRNTFRHLCLKIHHIAHCHRIGGSTSLQPYLSPEHSRKHIPLRQTGEQIMASRMLDNSRLSFYDHKYYRPLIFDAKIKNFRFYHYLCGI